MLGIIIIIAIGNFFYRLAKEYDKNVWLFAILGIVSYYAGTLIAGFVIGIVLVLNGREISDSDALMYGFMSIPVGVLTCVGLYFILKKVWSKARISQADTLDADELRKF